MNENKQQIKYPLNLHPDSHEGRAILKRYEQRSALNSTIGPDVAQYNDEPNAVSRHEVILNPANLSQAGTWVQFGFMASGALILLGGGIYAFCYLVSEAWYLIQMSGLNWKLVVVLPMIAVLTFLALKIKGNKTVIREHHHTSGKSNVTVGVHVHTRVN